MTRVFLISDKMLNRMFMFNFGRATLFAYKIKKNLKLKNNKDINFFETLKLLIRFV